MFLVFLGIYQGLELSQCGISTGKGKIGQWKRMKFSNRPIYIYNLIDDKGNNTAVQWGKG